MSEQQTFTPGPWEWNAGGRLFHSLLEKFASENVLVVHDPIWRPSPEDARLIAAAPDLLEALQAMLEPGMSGSQELAARDAAKAAISKALVK